MAKTADFHFQIHPWKIIEDNFSPEYAMVAESIFSLGNEYMGVRGYLEEGYQGPHLQGSYFNGVYERKVQPEESYKGVVRETEYIINALDWLYFRIIADGEQLDFYTSTIQDYKRELDMQSGLLTRSFQWILKSGAALMIKMERLISMEHISFGAQYVTISSLSYAGDVTVISGLDFNTFHGKEKKRLWECIDSKAEQNTLWISARTETTDKLVSSKCVLSSSVTELAKQNLISEEKTIAFVYTLSVKAGSSVVLQKTVQNISPLLEDKGEETLLTNPNAFMLLLDGNKAWWKKVWERSDIEIQGDEENQQGIRFCIFQMNQTYHGAASGTNIGAKGLTGEAYNGNAFWDTETYCLPFYLFHNKEAAKNLLFFRYATLDEAKKRAVMLDCKGAFYPVATISGRECCNLWQHASLQQQASTAVAYGIWCYEKILGDREFLEQYGLEMLIEICRMLATRGSYNNKHTHYGYYGVMGPDEFQMMVNHNCYTNLMGKFTFAYTLKTIEWLKKENPDILTDIFHKTQCRCDEINQWKQMEQDMFIPYDESTKLFEQHLGFFELPHIDVDAIPIEDFPLYNHWTYDRIYRNDMIKQPDVLMFLLLFNSSFSDEVLRANYEYYEPHCIHESSLSPSVHSILAAQLHKNDEAFEFFRFATRMDLDNYNRNTAEGIHTTSIAAAWMNIVYGFGGLRSDGKLLSLNPSIPKKWERYSFRIVSHDEVLCVEVDQKKLSLHTLNGGELTLCIYGKELIVGGAARELDIPDQYQTA